MDGQCDTRDRSSGGPVTQLQISYFIANLQYTIFYNIIGTEEDDKTARIDSRRYKKINVYCSKTSLTGETWFHCEFVHPWDANH
jgi:hypothetical protein